MSVRAEDLLEVLGISEPHEINIEAIAGYCGVDIRAEPLDGCEARLIGVNDRAIITVNSRSTAGRRRFSIGHELGHWNADRGRVSFLCEKEMVDGRRATGREERANAFSAELLMPKTMFLPRLKGVDITIDTVRKLKDLFAMSTLATALRVVELGPPAAVFVSQGLARRWWRAGPDLPESLRFRDELHIGSGAYAMVHDKALQGTEATCVSADVWTTNDGADEYEIIEQSYRLIDEEVISLLWWADESQLVDLHDQ